MFKFRDIKSIGKYTIYNKNHFSVNIKKSVHVESLLNFV